MLLMKGVAMERFKLKGSVKLDNDDGELMLVDLETGFVGKGNKAAYKVLNLLRDPKSEQEIIACLSHDYSESQLYRIKKAVPKILNWSMERKIVIGVNE